MNTFHNLHFNCENMPNRKRKQRASCPSGEGGKEIKITENFRYISKVSTTLYMYVSLKSTFRPVTHVQYLGP